ncbi:MAG: hypothetical protein LC104_16905 [Bacteroidales bacterium]|nr:hypothetical protein [Bacteroidales bacterium]
MPSPTALAEFRNSWLPQMTDAAIARVIDLLETRSPLLIHGAFTQCLPMGCLASHIAWNHPATQHLDEEAGVTWLTRIAGLNPATSAVIQSWDAGERVGDSRLREDLLRACYRESERRTRRPTSACLTSFC